MPDYLKQLNQERASREIAKKKSPHSPQTSKINEAELVFILLLTILKDFSDWLFLSFAGFGLIINRLTNIIITGILWFWCMMRLHKFPTKRFLGGFSVEMVPVIGTFSPTWTIFILSIWLEQKRHKTK